MSEISQIELAGMVANSDSYGSYYRNNYEASGSPKSYDLEAIFNNPQDNINEVYYLSKYYYAKSGIIMRVINIIRDFGVIDGGYENVYNKNVSDKVKNVISDFNERINLTQVMRDILFELALSGNVAGYNRNGQRIDIYPVTQIEVSPLVIGNKPVLLYKNNLSLDDIDLPRNLIRKLDLSYPKEVVKGIKKGDEKIVLDIDNTFFHKVNASRYEKYGLPFILTAFDELAHKTVLKEAERATATGIIEKILLIKVGDKEHKPKQKEIDFYSDLFDGKKGSIKATVPYFINAEFVEPETSIFGIDKFEQVDKDILNALGISLTLIRGEGGGNYSEGFISVTGLIKTIENLRECIPSIVGEWYRQELERNGLNPDDAPVIKLKPIEIDKSSRMEMLKYLFQSAGLPYRVLYEESGYDYDKIKLVREEENSEEIEEVFASRSNNPGVSNPDNPDNPDSKVGRPTKNLSERKSDKAQSNNDQPRPSTSK